jgi:hypothetical protein
VVVLVALAAVLLAVVVDQVALAAVLQAVVVDQVALAAALPAVAVDLRELVAAPRAVAVVLPALVAELRVAWAAAVLEVRRAEAIGSRRQVEINSIAFLGFHRMGGLAV